MNRSTPRRKASTWAVLLGCGFALVRCGNEQVAGSSVTTGNPTEIQVSFTGEDGPTAVAGRVEIYGATQIPVSGFQPEPLKGFDVDGESFTLDPSHLEGIVDSMWPAGSLVGDTLAHFNLVITGSDKGVIVRELSYLTKSAKFKMKDEFWLPGDKVGAARISVQLAPLTEYRAFIDPKRLSSNRHNLLLILGTGFSAKSDSGNFHFAKIPSGSHPLSFMSLPDRIQTTSPEDSALVYDVNKPLVAGQVDTLQTTGMTIQVPMPDEYKPNK